jgi:two-component system response regulator HydG
MPFVTEPAALSGTEPIDDSKARFRQLVESPLRAGLLRFLNARPYETFDVDALMSTFGRLRLDVQRCLDGLAGFGLAERVGAGAPRYRCARPHDDALAELLEEFLEQRAAISVEDQAPSVQRFREMLGRDEKMLVVFEAIRTAARSDVAVLIQGPAGSGKGIVARMIHELSRRARSGFETVNGGALVDTLFESEMFGYEKGAFTGANDRKPGRLELAAGGTLFLQGVGELSLTAQVKLERVLAQQQFQRLGGQAHVPVDVRLVSASDRPLDQLVGLGRFRDDLFGRLDAYSIRLPSLRERREDIPVLASRFVARYCAANGLPADGKVLSAEALARLQAYAWPGNIRELEGTASRAALSAPGGIIRESDLEFLHAETPVAAEAPRRLSTLRESERAHILRILDAVSWNKKEAARVLDISRGTLYRKILESRLDSRAALSQNRPHLR